MFSLSRAFDVRPRFFLAAPLLFSVACVCSVACGGLTREEARESLEEVKVASQSQALTTQGVEFSTHFTLGAGVKAAGEELREYLVSQLPCATVNLEHAVDSATVTIEYGARGGSCTSAVGSLVGKHIISVSRNEADLVQVDHVFDSLSNGRVKVDGTATVEWDFENESRHVVHDALWTRLSDGRTGEGSGDRVQRPLAGGLKEGFSVDGEQHWKGKRGTWDLDIDQVEMRWADPVPQAGTYTLDTPFGKRVTLSFERQSETAIEVTIAGPRRSFDFTVASLPDGEETADSGEASFDGADAGAE